jgi:hypothetical protein
MHMFFKFIILDFANFYVPYLYPYFLLTHINIYVLLNYASTTAVLIAFIFLAWF